MPTKESKKASETPEGKKEDTEGKKEDIFRYKKIDLHTHILPDQIPDFGKLFGYGEFIQLKFDNTCGCNAKMYKGDQFFREVAPNCFKPEPRIEDCKESGVSVQVLSTVPVMFCYWAKPRDGLIVAKQLNNHISSVCKTHPKKFVGLGTLPMQCAELAVPELERCMGELGMAGIEIGSHINDKPLGHPDLFPVFQACERLGAAVFIHPWDMPGSKLREKHWLPWLVGMPAETSFAICSLIFGGVLERLPKLRVCLAHGGGSFPQTIGRVEHGWRCRPDLCATDCSTNPREYLGKFWVDSLVHDVPTLEFIAKLIGHEKIVLGSDYPFPLGEIATNITPEQRPGRVVEKSSLTEQQKADILWYNGLEFLGLKEEQFLDDDECNKERAPKKVKIVKK